MADTGRKAKYDAEFSKRKGEILSGLQQQIDGSIKVTPTLPDNRDNVRLSPFLRKAQLNFSINLRATHFPNLLRLN